MSGAKSRNKGARGERRAGTARAGGGEVKKSFNRICKLSQDATNELWSVTLHREYKTPAQKKRAIERVVRGAIEAALGAKSTTGGWDVDDISDWLPIFGNSEPVEAVRNPYEKDSP